MAFFKSKLRGDKNEYIGDRKWVRLGTWIANNL